MVLSTSLRRRHSCLPHHKRQHDGEYGDEDEDNCRPCYEVVSVNSCKATTHALTHSVPCTARRYADQAHRVICATGDEECSLRVERERGRGEFVGFEDGDQGLKDGSSSVNTR